jgi:hypothetical protein
MKKILLLAGLLGLFPTAVTQAAERELFPGLFSDEIHLKEEVRSFSALRDGEVLGASTDDTMTPNVTKKLDKLTTSYFRDIKIKPPHGWYLNDESTDYEEDGEESTGFSTYIVNEELTAQIFIFRLYDESLTLKEMEAETEALCELCGYEITKKGNAKLGKLKGRYIEATSPESHFIIYLFDVGDVSYAIQISAPLDEWKAYKPILTKSFASIKIDSKKLLDSQE